MVPFDASQHIQGIAQGVQNAMPGIQAAMPGDENIQQFINEFQQRRQAGEPKESIMADLLPKVKAMAMAPTPQVPNAGGQSDLGMVNGTPALGPQGALAAPVAAGPNTMAGPPSQPPIPQMPAPAPQTPGIAQTAAAPQAPIQQPMQPRMMPPMPQTTPQQGPGVSPTDQSYQSNSNNRMVMPASMLEQPTAEPYTEKPQIDLMRNPQMQTSTEPGRAPSNTSMNRGQQERAMQGIQQIKSMEARDAAQSFKYSKQEQDASLKGLKLLVDAKRNDQKFMMELENLKLAIEGQDTGKQKFIIDMFMKNHMNEADNAAGIQKSRIAASRARSSGGAAKYPPEMQDVRRFYLEARAHQQKLETSFAKGSNPEAYNTAKRKEEEWRKKYNKVAAKFGYPEIDENYAPDETEE